MRSASGYESGLSSHCVDHGKDGGVGADAERQGGDRGDGEAGVLDEHVQRMLDVIPEISHWCPRLRNSCQNYARYCLNVPVCSRGSAGQYILTNPD